MAAYVGRMWRVSRASNFLFFRGISVCRPFHKEYFNQPLVSRPLGRAGEFTSCRNIQTSCSFLGKGTPVKMPSLSPTMAEGTIIKWHKKEGDAVNPGDALCDIQTDKAVMTFEMDEEAILAKIIKPDDSKDVKVGTLIALMVEPGEDWKSVEMPDDVEASAVSTDAAAPAAAASGTAASGGEHESLSGIGPAVRNLLGTYNISADKIKGSGPHGRVTKADVLNYVKAQGLKPAPIAEVAAPVAPKPSTPPASAAPSQPKMPLGTPGSGPYVDLELSGMRATIARRLTESKVSIPHAYMTAEADITELMNERKRMKELGVKVSVNDFVVKAVAEALMRCPNVNVLNQNGQIKWHPSIDISVAVATEAGLITPIVFNASKKNVETISAEVKDLAKRAKENKLKLDEFQGGSFTISNLGMFGIKEFTAIINLPQCAILAVGGGSPILGGDGKFYTKMRSSLSYDARAISEGDAAEFMEIYRLCLETPSLLLRGSAGTDRYKAELYAN